MTKQEKIQEAYPKELWEYIDEDGWFNPNNGISFLKAFKGIILLNKVGEESLGDRIKRLFEQKFEIPLGNLHRLKSLQGIETNNGWIKIESEGQIKNFQNEFCWVIVKSGKVEKMYIHSSNLPFILKMCTHYQPITKPEPPLY